MLTAKELLGRAQALEPQLVEWRRTLHRHPEVGFDLTQTKVLQHFHRLSVLHGGIFADNLFCRNLHEARRTNEYVQPEC